METEEAIDIIKHVLDALFVLHRDASSKWIDYSKERDLIIFNQRKIQVADLEKTGLINTVSEYSSYLNDTVEMNLFSKIDIEGVKIVNRIKTPNSIQEKIDDYCMYRPEKGKVSVNKCFNDLYGARVVLDCPSLVFDDIRHLVEGYGDNLSIEDKKFSVYCSETDYVATHVYIKGDGPNEVKNKTFRWELQIWLAHQERNNHNLHKHHRFRYREWENDGKHVQS